jgi:phytoene dehydrogenase-like protein
VSSRSEAEVAVVGAGAAGLCCALHLSRAGIPVRVFEAAGEPGGRIATERVQGFLLDRGFQVLTTSYPEARSMLDLEALRLGRFLPGALVRSRGRFERFVDPLRAPGQLLGTLRGRAVPLRDKLRILALRRRVCGPPLESLYQRPERSTLEHLRERGFSEDAIEHFFRPFFSGVFLERDLATSSRFFEFTFRMFALGEAALPAQGMAAIPRQLAAGLPPECLRTGALVDAIEDGALRVGGERIPASAVVVATDAETAARLVPELPVPDWNGTTCLSFSAQQPPVREPILVLDGEGRGPVNHLCVPSQVSPSYGAEGRALVSATVLGVPAEDDAELEAAVRRQLSSWFGGAVERWSLLRIQRVPKALPRQPAGWLEPVGRPVRVGPRRFVCGDHRDLASIHGAMHAGRRAARAVQECLQGG